jgi:hypothetical protein
MVSMPFGVSTRIDGYTTIAAEFTVVIPGGSLIKRALAVLASVTATAALATTHRQNPFVVLIACLLSSPLDEIAITTRNQSTFRSLG